MKPPCGPSNDDIMPDQRKTGRCYPRFTPPSYDIAATVTAQVVAPAHTWGRTKRPASENLPSGTPPARHREPPPQWENTPNSRRSLITAHSPSRSSTKRGRISPRLVVTDCFVPTTHG